MDIIDGVYYGKSTETKPTNMNQVVFWFNIDADAEHKLYAFDPTSNDWVPQD